MSGTPSVWFSLEPRVLLVSDPGRSDSVGPGGVTAPDGFVDGEVSTPPTEESGELGGSEGVDSGPVDVLSGAGFHGGVTGDPNHGDSSGSSRSDHSRSRNRAVTIGSARGSTDTSGSDCGSRSDGGRSPVDSSRSYYGRSSDRVLGTRVPGPDPVVDLGFDSDPDLTQDLDLDLGTAFDPLVGQVSYRLVL